MVSWAFSVIAIDNAVAGGKVLENMSAEWQKYHTELTAAFEHLIQAKPLTCAATQTEFPAIPAPATVVIDVKIPQGRLGARFY